MMARNTNVPFKGRIQTHYLQIITFGLHARPVHTERPEADFCSGPISSRDAEIASSRRAGTSACPVSVPPCLTTSDCSILALYCQHGTRTE
jgi:hypothetical protein